MTTLTPIRRFTISYHERTIVYIGMTHVLAESNTKEPSGDTERISSIAKLAAPIAARQGQQNVYGSDWETQLQAVRNKVGHRM